MITSSDDLRVSLVLPKSTSGVLPNNGPGDGSGASTKRTIFGSGKVKLAGGPLGGVLLGEATQLATLLLIVELVGAVDVAEVVVVVVAFELPACEALSRLKTNELGLVRS